jgi:hypothetical protein
MKKVEVSFIQGCSRMLITDQEWEKFRMWLFSDLGAPFGHMELDETKTYIFKQNITSVKVSEKEFADSEKILLANALLKRQEAL